MQSIRLSLDVPASAFTVVAGPPEYISQRTVEHETGVPPRSYLEDLASGTYDGEVIKRGKLRITHRAEYVAFLRRRSEAARAVVESAEPRGAVLADLGLRVVGGTG
jgi:hypothetical protein